MNQQKDAASSNCGPPVSSEKMQSAFENSTILQHQQNDGDKVVKVDGLLEYPTPPQIVQPSRIKQRRSVFPPKSVKQIHGFFEAQGCVSGQEEDHSEQTSAIRELSQAEIAKLPENYMILAEFFDHLETSIRLLGLRKKVPTFHNISIQVEILAKRKFLHKHLAQMKYIFPEALLVEKILTHDAATLCMRPDIKVTFLSDAVIVPGSSSLSLTLRHGFRTRLFDFFTRHPDEANVPEASLPESFSQKQKQLTAMNEIFPAEPPMMALPLMTESGSLLHSSHFSPHFCRQFLCKHVSQEDIQQTSSQKTFTFVSSDKESCEDAGSPLKEKNLLAHRTNDTPIKYISAAGHYLCSNSSGSRPAKLISSPETETPLPQPPKRPSPSPSGHVNVKPMSPSHPTAKRSLDFSLLLEDDGPDSTPEAELLKTEKSLGSIAEEWMSKSCGERQHQMVACLTALFDTIQTIFRSGCYSFITKQELLHKILWHSIDVIEPSEVEEHLDLLKEFLPSLISRKLVPSGDELYYVKTLSDSTSVGSVLVEAMKGHQLPRGAKSEGFV